MPPFSTISKPVNITLKFNGETCLFDNIECAIDYAFEVYGCELEKQRQEHIKQFQRQSTVHLISHLKRR